MAVGKNEEIIGKRIKKARKMMGLRQKELATSVGFKSSQIISSIEKGERDVKAWELFKIASALYLDVSSLLGSDDLQEQPAVYWRETPTENKSEIERRFLKVCNDYHFIENCTGYVPPNKLPTLDKNLDLITFEELSVDAHEISRQMGLGRRPSQSLENYLSELYGIKIWYDDLKECSAASTKGDFGFGILMNKNEAPWRRNYNFAHELFHLITWNFTSSYTNNFTKTISSKRIEQLANHFAASLLLPADEVRNEYKKRIKENKIKFLDLIQIAREFDVSTSALLWRLKSLELLKEKTVKSLLENKHLQKLDKSSMGSKWRKPSPLPERYLRLAHLAYIRDSISRSRFAELLNVSLIDLSETLALYGLNDEPVEDGEVPSA